MGVLFILGLQAHSLSGEVSDYFTSSNIDISSISAVSQRRDLLYPKYLNLPTEDFFLLLIICLH